MVIKRVSTPDEILGIKRLQQQNQKDSLSPEEWQREGFVTAEYSLEFLEKMNQLEPSVIAKDQGAVVGYALVVSRTIVGHHDLLDDLFRQIDRHSFEGDLLRQIDYVVVGQLCVAKSHRGQGLVQRMYELFRSELLEKYKYCLTDVDTQNPRSLKAHFKSGFQILDTLEYGGSSWFIVIWDWRKR